MRGVQSILRPFMSPQSIKMKERLDSGSQALVYHKQWDGVSQGAAPIFPRDSSLVERHLPSSIDEFPYGAAWVNPFSRLHFLGNRMISSVNGIVLFYLIVSFIEL